MGDVGGSGSGGIWRIDRGILLVKDLSDRIKGKKREIEEEQMENDKDDDVEDK